MSNYLDLINDKIKNVYQAGIATKILQLMDRIRNVSDLSQSRRWVMELLQNARDIGYEDECVKIKIEYTDEYLKFSHTGKPFRVKDILSIINQVSSKQADGETVGRFGTGFMSTYQLSEQVEITSVLRDIDASTGEYLPYKPFTVSIDRSGRNNDSILAAISDSINQLSKDSKLDGLYSFDKSAFNTTFTYKLKNEACRICAKTGILDLKENILFILLFSSKIDKIEIIYENSHTIYKNVGIKDIGNGIKELTIAEYLNNVMTNHHILFSTLDNITLAVGVDDNKNLIPISSKTPRLFIDFPLIGAESFPFPIVINSRGFKPNEPRSGITLVDNQNSLDAVVNKRLIQKSVTEYIRFLGELVSLNYKHIENIIKIPHFIENKEVSTEWVKANVYGKLFENISKIPFIETDNGLLSLNTKNLFIINSENSAEANKIKKLLMLLNGIYTPTNDCDWFDAFSGYEIPNGKIISVAKITKNADFLLRNYYDKEKCSIIEWCYELYKTAMENPKIAQGIESGEYLVFPNQVEADITSFKLYPIQEIKIDCGVPETLKDVTEILDHLVSSHSDYNSLKLRKQLLNKDFPSKDITKMAVFDMSTLYNYIKQRTSRNFPIDRYRCPKYNEYILKAWISMIACAKDKTVYKLFHQLYNTSISLSDIETDLYDDMWNNSFSGIIKTIVDEIEDIESLDALGNKLNYENSNDTIKWLNSVIFIANRFNDNLKSKTIFPNQNGKFIKGNYLYINSYSVEPYTDNTSDDTLKDIAFKFKDLNYKLDYKSYTLDRRLKVDFLPINKLSDEIVASAVNNIIINIMSKNALSEESESHQLGCSMLMSWLSKNKAKASLFPSFESDEDRMKLLTPNVALKLDEKANTLENILETFGCDDTEKLLELIRKHKDDEYNISKAETKEVYYSPEWDCFLGNEYKDYDKSQLEELCRKIGTAGEHQIFYLVCEEYKNNGYSYISGNEHKAILTDGNNKVTIDYPDNKCYHQPGWDIQISINNNNEIKKKFIEVKTHSTTSSYINELKISATQMSYANKYRENYTVAKVTYDIGKDSCTDVSYYPNISQIISDNYINSLTYSGVELYAPNNNTNSLKSIITI